MGILAQWRDWALLRYRGLLRITMTERRCKTIGSHLDNIMGFLIGTLDGSNYMRRPLDTGHEICH